MTNTVTQRLEQLLHLALGDALTAFLADPDLIEILLNPDGKVFIEYLSSGKKDAGIGMQRISIPVGDALEAQ